MKMVIGKTPHLAMAGCAIQFTLFLCSPAMAADIPAHYKLIYQQKFDSDTALKDFLMTDPGAWRRARTNDLTALELLRQSQYAPAVRSPVNIALLGDKLLSDFVLEADLMQTGREYGHRDMCLFFGFQSPTNFYYAHIATAADEHAHNVFIVNGAPRVKIAKETTKGVNWGLGVWHHVRLERRSADGAILVYFDDMTKPIMKAEDKTFSSGYVGFGSFDDTGMVDNIRVWAPAVPATLESVFKPANP